jgi:hypothetical protein
MFRDAMDLVLMGSWITVLGTMMVYRIYGKKGIAKKLWKRGIWFSENDVLHVLLILWMIYNVMIVANRVKDYTEPIHPLF